MCLKDSHSDGIIIVFALTSFNRKCIATSPEGLLLLLNKIEQEIAFIEMGNLEIHQKIDHRDELHTGCTGI